MAASWTTCGSIPAGHENVFGKAGRTGSLVVEMRYARWQHTADCVYTVVTCKDTMIENVKDSRGQVSGTLGGGHPETLIVK